MQKKYFYQFKRKWILFTFYQNLSNDDKVPCQSVKQTQGTCQALKGYLSNSFRVPVKQIQGTCQTVTGNLSHASYNIKYSIYIYVLWLEGFFLHFQGNRFPWKKNWICNFQRLNHFPGITKLVFQFKNIKEKNNIKWTLHVLHFNSTYIIN